MVIGAVLIAVSNFYAGWTVQGWKKDAEIADIHQDYAASARESRDKARAIEAITDDAISSILTASALEKKATKIIEIENDKREVRYVQSANARDCGISLDGVRLINSAATGERMPETASDSPEASGADIAVRNAELVPSVKRNYRLAREQFKDCDDLKMIIKSIYENVE
jgi:hypothetical protein